MGNTRTWGSAALDGILLSLITIIFSLLSSILEPKGILAFLIWLIKFGACIAVLYYFMKRYANQMTHISYKEAFMYGFWVCTFSSIICAAFNLISITFIFPEQASTLSETLQSAMAAQQLSGDEENTIMKIMDNFPSYMFVFSLLYYIILGIIYSSIIANFTKRTDPYNTPIS